MPPISVRLGLKLMSDYYYICNMRKKQRVQEFIEYFKDELPDPEHHPIKVRWLMRWWKSIVIRNRNADI